LRSAERLDILAHATLSPDGLFSRYALYLIGATTLALTTTACELITGRDCTSIAVPAVSVGVADSLSGTPVAVEAIVRVRDGAYLDSVIVPPPQPGYFFLPASLAVERTGNYDVTVTASGYRQWRQGNVRVRDANCHPQTAHLTARLVRAP